MSAISSEPPSALTQAWAAYRQSATNARIESGVLRNWRWRVLALTLAGASAGAAADVLRESAGGESALLVGAVGTAGSALLGVATILTATLLTVSRQRRWTNNRAVAEALKSECFRYAVRCTPYDSEDAASVLEKRTDRLVAALDREPPLQAGTRQTVELPDRMDAQDYLRRRVDDQETWYRGKAGDAEQRLGRFRLASIALGSLAAMLPVAGTLLDKPGPASWAALATTAGTAIGSFIYAERFAFLAETYTATANRLEALRRRWQASARSADDMQRLVADVEQALATENSAWMAELLREQE